MTNKQKHEQRIRLYESGLIDKEIAAECHCSEAAICSWRIRNGLPCNGNHLYRLPDIQEKLFNCYQRGLGNAATAEELGLSTFQVQKWRDENNLPPNHPAPVNRRRK